MKCALEGNNAKIFAKAVQSLSKIGADLFVEADQQGLLLRAINSTQSAVGSIRFKINFFDSYHVDAGDENYCKIAMKTCLTVFRTMKQVERCEMCILAGQTKFQVQLKCRLDTKKTVLLAIEDEENITASVSPDDTSNVISGSYKIFNEISSNFNTSEEEITLETKLNFCWVKNYIEGSRVNDKFMRSQLKLTSGEFDLYKIEKETNITFCLKEFRAFLLFAESLNENMVLNFDESGSPIFISIKHYNHLECTLVMSTLAPDDISFYDDCRPRDVTLHNNAVNSGQPPKRKLRKADTSSTHKSRKCDADDTTVSNTNSSLFQFNDVCNSGAQSVDEPRILTVGNDGPKELHIPVAAVSSTSMTPTLSLPNLVRFVETEENEDHQNGDDECIPASPPQPGRGQRVRSIFTRCFESTYKPKEPSPSSQAYVANSDTED